MKHMNRWLAAACICLALGGCGDDGETVESTGVDSSPSSGGNGGNPGSSSAGRLQFSASSMSAGEAAGNATITITRTGTSAGAASVAVTSRNGTATAPQDYTAVSTTVSFAAGDSAAKTVSLPIVNDTTDEADETLYLTLSSVTGASLGSTSEILVTINDDDVSAPAAPRAVISSAYKHLHVDWTAVTGATSYRLLRDPTGSSGYTQVGTDLPATATATDFEVVPHKTDWQHGLFAIAACNQAGCTQSSPMTATGLSMPLIGYLKAPQTAEFSYFGSAVALSADGNTLAVGMSSGGDATHPYSGVVYAYTRSGTGWSEPVVLTASNAENFDRFGEEIAISADGNTMVIGAPSEASGNADPADNSVYSAGAAYVFVRASGTWSQAAYLKPEAPIDSYEYFGSNVAISPDGSTVAVGRPYRTVPASAMSYTGAAYIFTRSDATWDRIGPIVAPVPEEFSFFGQSVALSDQGSTLVIGQPGATAAGLDGAGIFHQYSRSGNSWNLLRSVPAATAVASASFGGSASLSHDGTVLIVGATYENLVDPVTTDPLVWDAGAVYVFSLSTAAATQVARLMASNPGDYDYFGSRVAVSGDGRTFAVGVADEDGGSAGAGGTSDESLRDSGAAYVFTFDGQEWSQATYAKASNPDVGDGFGSSVALSGDGNMLAVGAPQEESAVTGFNGNQVDDCGGAASNCASSAGAVYTF